jgi:PPOX class F420-dependent enzyme/OxyR family protein
MNVFIEGEIEYMRSQTLARIATVGPDGHPHVIPVTFWFNDEQDTIDIGGIAFGQGKKWRDAKQNPKVTFLLDDTFGSARNARPARSRSGARPSSTRPEATRSTRDSPISRRSSSGSAPNASSAGGWGKPRRASAFSGTSERFPEWRSRMLASALST